MLKNRCKANLAKMVWTISLPPFPFSCMQCYGLPINQNTKGATR